MKVVLPKGRLFDESFELLEKSGLELTYPEDRKLYTKNENFELSVAKAFDVPVYVEHGIDIGISGKDVYEERDNDVFVPLELPFGECRLSFAMPENNVVDTQNLDGYDIATEYVNITERFLKNKNVKANVFKLNGSIELAPKIGIADTIVDIVETGNTLRANGLVEAEKIMDVSALLLVNRISQKTRFEEINELIRKIKGVIKDEY